MSSSMSAPDWIFDGKDGLENSDFTHVSNADYKRISKNVKTEEDIVAERNTIEKCASENKPYFLNGEWSDNVKSALREYAVICGMDMNNYQEVNVDSLPVIEAANEENIVKLASVIENRREKPKMNLKQALGDPFGINDVPEERSTTPRREDWEKIEPSRRLAERPVMMTNTIIPIGGGESYFANSDVNPARGQNSITDPGAIERLAEEETVDIASELKRQNEARANKSREEHASQDAELVDSMSEESRVKDGAPRGSVFLTEAMDAQPGLGNSSRQMGIYSDFDPKNLPERTQGERISEANEDRRRSIQREEAEEHEFRMQGSSAREISDTFADELKKHLGR